MKRFLRIVVCVFLMFAACSSIAVSQELIDAFNEFLQGYYDEFTSSPEQLQQQDKFGEAFMQIEQARFQNDYELMQKRLGNLGADASPEETLKIMAEIEVDGTFTVQKSLIEKAREIYPDEQYRKMQQRQFQLREGIIRRMESFNDHEDLLILSGMVAPSPIVGDGQPDFLELTQEQRDLITQQQKDTAFKSHMLLNNWMLAYHTTKEFSDKEEEIRQLDEKLQKMSMENHSVEEMQAIIEQTNKIRKEMHKGVLPQLKELLLKSREDYLRILTDAQKAKIDAVMNEMPDYMKNLFVEIDRQGGGLSILNSWQPGMGVPDVPNPNREAPRERPQSERAFPE